MKKYKKITLKKSSKWSLLYPQNQTLLFAPDINGYWCKEHKMGMPRIQAVISHYYHKHGGKQMSDKIEYHQPPGHDKLGRKIPKHILEERESQAKTAKFLGPLTFGLLHGPPPGAKFVDQSKKIPDEDLSLTELVRKWNYETMKKALKKYGHKIEIKNFIKELEDAKIPKREIDLIKVELGIDPSTDEDIPDNKTWKKLMDEFNK